MFFAACSGNSKYDDLMQRADSIMEVDDDSAMVAIRMLDGVKSQLPEFTQAQKMRYELLRHKAMNKAYIPFTSDSIMLEVTDYYNHHGSDNERMLAYYILGCVYRDMHEAPLALEYYNKATEQADTTSTDCDYAILFRIYGQMGILFDKQYLPYQVIQSFTKATQYGYLAKDTLNALLYYQNISGAYEFLGMPDSAFAINTRVAKKLQLLGYKREAAIAFGCNYDYYMKKKDWVNAKKAFDAYQSTGYEGNTNYSDSKAFVLYEKGLYYLCTSQLDSAYTYLMKSWEICKSFGNKCVTANALAQYYLKNNQSLLASKYALLSSEYNDSSIIEARHSQLQQMQAMYDYSRNQEKARKAEQKAEQRNRTIYIVILGSIAILSVATIIYRRQLILKKKRNAATRLLYEDSLLKLKKLQDELEHVVTENGKEQTMIVREKEEAINRLKKEVKEIREKYSNPLLSDTDVILRNSSIYKKIRYIEMHPRESLQYEDWGELAATIERLVPSFVPILKERVSPKDYQICLLVRMGIPSSSIANLVDLSASGVSAARKRMLEKLCNKVGSPKDLDRFVCQIT